LGAPLGVMAKRGGLGISTMFSIGFFLFYYILLIGGEELADRNKVSAVIGMWTPNIALAIIALYLTLYTIRERSPIPILPFFKKKVKD
jgi:lipopolysaccharide export system permease protein